MFIPLFIQLVNIVRFTSL